MRNPIRSTACLLVALVISLPALAHSGRTDSNGGHLNRKTGEYHYHSGPKASPPISVGAPSPRVAFPQKLSGQVTHVVDGDDLNVLIAEEVIQIRLYGIDAPERNQPFSYEATQAARLLAHRKIVTVHFRDYGTYGRIIGEVVLPDGRSLSRELVDQGLAWWYRQYAPDDKVLEAVEGRARDAQRGLWSQSDPMPPWEYRSVSRSEKKHTDIASEETHLGKVAASQIANLSMAQTLASLDLDRIVADPEEAKQYSHLLGLLSDKFDETEDRIGNMTVAAVDSLEQQRINSKNIEVMEAAQAAVISKRDERDYAVYLGVYITYRSQDWTHDEAVDGMRTIFQILSPK